MKEGIYSLLGLCKKAGRLTSGETGVLDAVTSQKARLVIVAQDASDNTKKRFFDKCRTYQIRTITFGTVGELGRCTGKGTRAVIAVTDEGLATAIRERIEAWQKSE